MQYTTHYASPLGAITLVSNGNAIVGLWFDGQKHDRGISASECQERDVPVSARSSGDTHAHSLRANCNIRRDRKRNRQKTRASKMAAQAVGGAVGWNPISLIIPCHRVVGTGGSLTGYGGGIQRKLALLRLEKVNTEGLFIPKKGTAL